MTPEIALLVRAALLGLLVLGLERAFRRRRLRRSRQLQPVVRLPATINPVLETVMTRPVQLNLVKPAGQFSAQPEVVRLDSQKTPYIPDKRAA